MTQNKDWLDGWLEGQPKGCEPGWEDGYDEGYALVWLDGCDKGWLDGWIDDWLDGCELEWEDGCNEGWLDGWLEGCELNATLYHVLGIEQSGGIKKAYLRQGRATLIHGGFAFTTENARWFPWAS